MHRPCSRPIKHSLLPMITRNWLLIALANLLLSSGLAKAAQLTVSPLSLAPGETAHLEIHLAQSTSLNGLQFDVSYPTVLASSPALPGADLTAGCLVDSEIIANDGQTESRRILIHSPVNLAFGDGHLLSIPLTPSADAPQTPHSIGITAVVGGNSTAQALAVAGGASTIQVIDIETYTITATVFGTNGRVTPSGQTTVQAGSNLTLSIEPDPGFVIDQLFVDGTPVSPMPEHTFSSVSEDHILLVSFKAGAATSLTLSYTPSQGGGVTASLSFSGSPGSVITVETSSDLTSWTPVGTVTLDAGSTEFDLLPFLAPSTPQFFRAAE